MKFVGRKEELATLNLLHRKSSSSLVVIRGRRRIGKTRLIQEFGKGKRILMFTGVPPNEATNKSSQIENFLTQMGQVLGSRVLDCRDWLDVFFQLGQSVREGQVVIVFDEISWIGSKDPDFLGKLKTAWDLYFSPNPQLILILCGSVSSWIERNILKSTGFVGRISLNMVVRELPLMDCGHFWEGHYLSAKEKLQILSVTGGVPRYLEEVMPALPVEANINKMCFSDQGLLFREFDHIFTDLFRGRNAIYQKIVEILADRSACDLNEIAERLGRGKGGHLSEMLDDLVLAGFVQEDATWNIATLKRSNLRKYRLSDPYLRFYLKYIRPKREQIIQRGTKFSHANLLSALGYQFENLVLNQVDSLFPFLDLDPKDVAWAGHFFQRSTQRKEGCQVDLLIQTSFRVLYVCEIKSGVNGIQPTVIKEVSEKIRKLTIPKHYAVRRVLIHSDEPSPKVVEAFDYVVDFTKGLGSS